MAGIVLLFLEPIGQRVFKNVLTKGAFGNDTTLELKDIAPALTKAGWPCSLVTHNILTDKGTRTAYGLQFPDMEAITAFILRWG